MDIPIIEDQKLHALYISEEASVAVPGSLAHEKMVSYASLVETLYTIVFTPFGFGGKNERVGANLWLYPTNSFFFLWNILSVWRIVTFQITWKFKLQANLVIAETPYLSGLIGYFIARRHKKRFIVRVPNDFLDPYFKRASLKNRIKSLFAGIVIREATWIEVASEKIKTAIIAFAPELKQRISVTLPYIDVEKIAALPIETDIRKKYPQFGFIIVLQSQLSRDKEVSLALGVVRLLVKRYPKTGLVIVGSGGDKFRLALLARYYGIRSHIVFERDTKDMYSYYKTANATMVTSRYEDHALQLLEALACSCPVVTTPVGVARELLSMPLLKP
jgi:glycosyltransferase involved in cell wall biosynthesis